MLDTLRLVRGAVAQKELVPLMTHFIFNAGRVQGSNGRITIDAPLDLHELDGCSVPAEKFYRAVEACDGEPKIQRDGHFVHLRKGRFRVKLPVTSDAKMFTSPPAGKVDGHLTLDPFRRLLPYVSQDASRPWSIGILLASGYGYATNNVIVARAPLDYTGPNINLPSYCVEELLVLGNEQCEVSFAENGLYLKPRNDVWLHTRSLSLEWPDVTRFFAEGFDQLVEVETKDLLRVVRKLRTFVPDNENPVIIIEGETVRTLEGDSEAEDAVQSLTSKKTAWRAEPLELMLAQATAMDLSQYPHPCPWKGHGLEGRIVGMRAQ